MKHSGEDLQNIWKGLLSFAVKLDGTFENDVYINSKWLNCVEKCSEFPVECIGVVRKACKCAHEVQLCFSLWREGGRGTREGLERYPLAKSTSAMSVACTFR